MSFKCKIGFHKWEGNLCSECGRLKKLKQLKESVIIIAGPAPTSDKKVLFNSLKKLKPEPSIFICTSVNDFSTEINNYNKTKFINVLIFYSLNSHPYGRQYLTNWIDEFFITLDKEISVIKKTSKLDSEVNIWGDDSATIKFSWKLIQLTDVINYLIAIEKSYSKTKWPTTN